MKLELGTWLSIGSPVIAELAALCGFDWVLLDLEHGFESEAAMPNQLRALRGRETKGIVRVGAPHPEWIGRVLDWGADGVMVPRVETPEQARRIVSSAHYAPKGRRGYSRTVPAFAYGMDLADREPRILVQIETAEGVRNASDIAAVEGIDVLFVGPADLNHDLQSHPDQAPCDFGECLRRVVTAASDHGKMAGILVREPEAIAEMAALGFKHIAVELDVSILRKGYQAILSHRPDEA